MNKRLNLKVIVLGVSGMIGSEIYRIIFEREDLEVFGTVRSKNSKSFPFYKDNIVNGIDVLNEESWKEYLIQEKPDAVINCIGITKHIETDHNKNLSIQINSIFPHKLAHLCDQISARLIHISSDCVFSGKKGFYSEKDIPDSDELYGLSKKLGEINSSKHLTIRTSTIGHEITTKHGLLEWFLSQEKRCKGYKKAIFSGVPTHELALIIANKILEYKQLSGIYNLSSSPISKYDLLGLIKRHYSKDINIEEDSSFIIDRSLDGTRLKKILNYDFDNWDVMTERMAQSRKERQIV